MNPYKDFDNVIIVPTEIDSVEELVDHYVKVIKYCSDDEDLREALTMFFEDICDNVEKDFNIRMALQCIEVIKEITFGNVDDED